MSRLKRTPVRRLDLGPLTVGVDPHDLRADAQLGSGLDGGTRQGPTEGAHPAHRHVPVPGAVADHVVEEAAVLAQLRIVGGGEGSDQRVGGHDPAHQVAVELGLERERERLLEQRRPRRLVVHQRAERRAGNERLGQRPEHPPRDPGGERAKALERGHRAVVAAGAGDRVARPLRVVGDQHAGVAKRRVGRDPPPAHLDAYAELREQLAREQADEIGVARDARVDAGKRRGRDRGSAGVICALEHQHAPARSGQHRRGDQAVVAGAHDDRVERG